jgi:hypothetical protein
MMPARFCAQARLAAQRVKSEGGTPAGGTLGARYDSRDFGTI